MNTPQRTSDCSIISIASACSAKSLSALALIAGQRAIDLTELAQSIRVDRELCDVVTEAAFQQYGLPQLRLEDAIVLLGRKCLCMLLSSSVLRDRSATKLRRTRHRNHITPSANLFLLETFQGETK